MAEAEILRINKQAMEQLRIGNTAEALKLLNSAQEILPQLSSENIIWGLTFNNLGCYFKKTKQFDIALKHFYKALDVISKKSFDILTLSGTYLSISSIYSETKFHEKALSFAIKAYQILYSSSEKNLSIWTSLIISHSCIGQEYEFLNKKDKAYNIYLQGWQLSIEKLGKKHKLTLNLKKKLQKCQALKSSSVIPGKSIKTSAIQTRSQSSNSSSPQSRILLPDMPTNLISPTKNYYNNIQKIPRKPVKISPVPIKQIDTLNNLVHDIEMSFKHKQRKYVFKKAVDDEVDIVENPQRLIEKHKNTNKNNKNLPIIRRNTTGYIQDPSTNNYLHIIPEARNENVAERLQRKTPVKKTLKL